MSRITEDWIAEKLEQLKIATANYSNQEKEQIRLPYLNNLLLRLAEFDIDKKDILIEKIESIINCLPKDFEELMTNNYQPLFSDLALDVKKRFDLVPKNFHRNDFNLFSTTKLVGYILCGITIYLISILLEKPALAIMIGFIAFILFNTTTSVLLDKKAQRENRVL